MLISSRIHIYRVGWCPCGVVVNVLDRDIVISEFELQLWYYVVFQSNTLREGMNPVNP